MRAVERFLRVLRREPVDRPPVVGVTSVVTLELMRMAGTGWPAAHHDPELMLRAGAAAHLVAGLESVKVPFDMAVEAEALGAEVDFGAEAILPRIVRPRFERPEALSLPEDFLSRGRVPVVLEAVRLARARYGETVPVIVSIQGPFTLAGSLFGVEEVMGWLIEEPETLHAALAPLTALVAGYIRAQHRAGAHVVQVGEPLASGDLISPEQYARFAAPCHRELTAAAEGPVVTHICGDITRQLPHLAGAGFSGVSFDAKTEIRAAREHLRGRQALIGYLSTDRLLSGSPAEVAAAARECLREGVDALNAGCAVPPLTPLENIRAMVAAARGA